MNAAAMNAEGLDRLFDDILRGREAAGSDAAWVQQIVRAERSLAGQTDEAAARARVHSRVMSSIAYATARPAPAPWLGGLGQSSFLRMAAVAAAVLVLAVTLFSVTNRPAAVDAHAVLSRAEAASQSLSAADVTTLHLRQVSTWIPSEQEKQEEGVKGDVRFREVSERW